MDAPGQPPAGPRTGPEGAAAGRGPSPSPEAATEEEEAAAAGRSRTGKRRGCRRLGERRGGGASILGRPVGSPALPRRGGCGGMRR
ncbi:unnamed protein product [Bubo scandiacus]